MQGVAGAEVDRALPFLSNIFSNIPAAFIVGISDRDLRGREQINTTAKKRALTSVSPKRSFLCLSALQRQISKGEQHTCKHFELAEPVRGPLFFPLHSLSPEHDKAQSGNRASPLHSPPFPTPATETEAQNIKGGPRHPVPRGEGAIHQKALRKGHKWAPADKSLKTKRDGTIEYCTDGSRGLALREDAINR